MVSKINENNRILKEKILNFEENLESKKPKKNPRQHHLKSSIYPQKKVKEPKNGSNTPKKGKETKKQGQEKQGSFTNLGPNFIRDDTDRYGNKKNKFVRKTPNFILGQKLDLHLSKQKNEKIVPAVKNTEGLNILKNYLAPIKSIDNDSSFYSINESGESELSHSQLSHPSKINKETPNIRLNRSYCEPSIVETQKSEPVVNKSNFLTRRGLTCDFLKSNNPVPLIRKRSFSKKVDKKDSPLSVRRQSSSSFQRQQTSSKNDKTRSKSIFSPNLGKKKHYVNQFQAASKSSKVRVKILDENKFTSLIFRGLDRIKKLSKNSSKQNLGSPMNSTTELTTNAVLSLMKKNNKFKFMDSVCQSEQGFMEYFQDANYMDFFRFYENLKSYQVKYPPNFRPFTNLPHIGNDRRNDETLPKTGLNNLANPIAHSRDHSRQCVHLTHKFYMQSARLSKSKYFLPQREEWVPLVESCHRQRQLDQGSGRLGDSGGLCRVWEGDQR